MLTNKSVVSAINLAEELDKRNISLTAIPNSPLERLLQLSNLSDITNSIVPMTEYTPNVDQIVLDSNTPGHAEELISFGEDIATQVSNHLDFAKNKVKPAIEELVESLKQRYKDINDSIKVDLDIEIFDLPEPMREVSFEQDISKYDNVMNIPVSFTLNYDGGTITDDASILELIKTGENVLDASIETWVIRLGNGYLGNIFESIIDASKTPIQTLIESDVNAALFTFLLANKLYNNPISGFIDELDNFNRKVADLRNQSALKILGAYNTHRLNIATGNLIKNYSANKVIVFGDTYRPWIEAGGDVKAIFGSTLLNDVKTRVSEINEISSELISNWTKRTQFKLSAIRSQEFISKKEAFVFALDKLVNDNFVEFYGHLVPEGTTPTRDIPEYKEYVRLSEEFISKIKESDMNNIWNLCTLVVCDCIFYYTSAHDILENINEVMKNNPEMEIREATLLATTQYVVDYVCAQYQINK